MKKMVNAVHAEGYFYKHDLKKKVSGEKAKNPGVEYINGTLDVATNEACTNIVSFHFSYVTAKTNSGQENRTFTLLSDIIDGKYKSVMGDGKEVAVKLAVDSAIDVNDFYDKKDELVSAKRNEGGFVNVVSELNEDESKRATFKTDMIITGTKEVEADEEKNLPRKLILKGHIFNFRNEIMPVEFSVLNEGAMNYFEDLEPSSKTPVFTQISGEQVSLVYKVVKTEESAFGDDLVTEVERSRKDYVVTWSKKEPYVWDDEEFILASEVAEALANRQVKLAEIKQRNDEYKNSKKATPAVASAVPGGFTF